MRLSLFSLSPESRDSPFRITLLCPDIRLFLSFRFLIPSQSCVCQPLSPPATTYITNCSGKRPARLPLGTMIAPEFQPASQSVLTTLRMSLICEERRSNRCRHRMTPGKWQGKEAFPPNASSHSEWSNHLELNVMTAEFFPNCEP